MVNPVTQKKRGRPTGARSPDASTIRTGGRFTNTAVPKFDGDGCWQQHLQFFNAIAKSNGWADETAALQLFAHLEGGGPQCGSPNRSGSCYVRHGVGDFSDSGVRRYGYLRPQPDGLGQVYCGPTELWAATSPIECSSGYADP